MFDPQKLLEQFLGGGKPQDGSQTPGKTNWGDAQSIETSIRGVAESRGVKAATLIHALRVAMTGKSVSPGLFEVVALLGRDRVRKRIRDAAALSVERHG